MKYWLWNSFLYYNHIQKMDKKTKACPFCWEEILEGAKKCKHCWEFLEEDEKVETKEEKKIEKKGSIGKWIVQFLIFFVLMWVGMVWCKESLWWLFLFLVALFRYCFVSNTDSNYFFEKESFTNRLKTSKKRRIRFVIIWFLRGRMMLWDYQWKWSESIHSFQQSTADSMEKWLDDLEQWVQDTTNKTIQELEEMK